MGCAAAHERRRAAQPFSRRLVGCICLCLDQAAARARAKTLHISVGSTRLSSDKREEELHGIHQQLRISSTMRCETQLPRGFAKSAGAMSARCHCIRTEQL